MKNTFKILIFSLTVGFSINLLAQQNYDKVDAKSIFINGKIPFNGKKKEVVKYLGKVDKIENFQPECGSYAEFDTSIKFQFYTSKSITYLIYKDQADFSEIDFNKDTSNFVLIKKHRLSNNTTTDELKKLFPKSYIEYKKENTGTFRLLFDIDGCDDQIQFYIKNNKIESMEYWTPC